jgi:glyceraldehyde-3-phosphate dehydrogenase/erythrose-4-phosphate dehydrogenase
MNPEQGAQSQGGAMDSIAINGLGRIGRAALKVLEQADGAEVVAAMTRVVDGALVKVMSWYDNEWGFTCQMIREAFAALALPAPDLSRAGP